MATEYALFPRTGDSIRAHSVLWQRMNAANAGYCGISGMDPSRISETEVSIASGIWLNKGVPTDFFVSSIINIPEATDEYHRYDLIVMDGTDSTLKRVAGTEGVPSYDLGFLNNYSPKPPELPNLKCYLIAILRIDDYGLSDVNVGNYCISGIADVRMISPPYAKRIEYPVVADAVGMNADGSLSDSGVAFATLARRAGTPTLGNISSLDSDGDPTDSGVPATALTEGWMP